MTRTLGMTAWSWTLALAVACGGGGTKAPPDYGQPDTGNDVAVPDEGVVGPDGEDASDVPATPDDVPVAPDDPGPLSDEAAPPEDEGVSGPDDTGVDAPEAGEVVQPECPCQETPVAWVCGIDGKDYVNDQCAKCALCKDDPVTCVGCTGEKACDPTDPLGPDGWIKQKEKCAVCICEDQTECERLFLEYPCGPFCDLSGQTWQTPCEMKMGYGCSPDYDENIEYFGACEGPPCEPCEGLPEDPVCGTDGQTYYNYCTLMNCPETTGAALAYLGHCLNAQFCGQCASQPKEAVCGDDGVTYANECAAVTCLGHQVAYPGPCCVDCPPDGPGVCGADFQTYPNECVLICLGIAKKYDGPCVCDCDVTGPEVCGSDGKTHPNECWLACLGLDKLYDGPCQGECPMCGKDFTPVCGTDNKTYQNACWLGCKQATQKNQGVCSGCQAICGTPENPTGGVVPACGPDGVTYPNACFATKCVGYPEGQVTAGPCP